ncbi:hypothetical protein [Sporolactobacillus pectinivorans]|uniref:hypothetical protein n=1 Tax=Sporolactobacillus pectinivorans TaxID=1591408 RepID=UPI000C2656AD|nr:hypothetical protein [Sporolactobacillus pectinivorans]
MTSGYFTFNNGSSLDYGLKVAMPLTIPSPSRDVTFQAVPGRTGDLVIDNKRFENVNFSFNCSVFPKNGLDLTQQAGLIKNWLQSVFSYQKLWTDIDPDYYHMAFCNSALDLQEVIKYFGKANIIFSCKAFKYRVDGDNTQTLTAPGTITNPEVWASNPYIKITGTGNITLHINDQDVVLTSVSQYIELDTNLQSAYKGTQLLNNQLFSDCPVLEPGVNNISWDGTVTQVDIVPRWWAL